jgi:hypothetical protein
MAQSPRIIRLESPSATQNVVDNMNEDIFMPMDGDYENAFGDGLKNIFKKKEKKEGDGKDKKSDKSDGEKRTAKSWWADMFGTKDERVAKRTARRKNRAERKANRLKRKSAKQIQLEAAAEQRALALGKSKAEAEALAQQEGAKRKAQEEAAITQAEEKAKADALAKGLPPPVAEDLSNKAGEQMEQSFGGYGTDGSDVKPSFWGSMSTGAKIGLIGGGVLVTGLIIWGIVASNKNK